MIPQNLIPIQPHRNTSHPITPSPATWPYRGWLAQAQRMYRTREAQRLALLQHCDILCQHAPTVERLLWLDALGRDLAEEVGDE